MIRYTNFRKPDHVEFNTQSASVELTPAGNGFRWRVRGSVCCSRNLHKPMRKSGKIHKDDLGRWLKNTDKIHKANRRRVIVLPLGAVGYDYCDYVK